MIIPGRNPGICRMMVKSNTGNCQFIGLFILYQPLTQNSHMKNGEKTEVEEIRVKNGTTPNYALGH